jgi:hypothetical protein
MSVIILERNNPYSHISQQIFFIFFVGGQWVLWLVLGSCWQCKSQKLTTEISQIMKDYRHEDANEESIDNHGFHRYLPGSD